MNFDRLRFVAERAELGEGREALLSVDIPERPGRCGHAPAFSPDTMSYLSPAFLPFTRLYTPAK